MKGMKTMSEEELYEAVQGHDDVITPAVQAAETFYRNQGCPECGAECEKTADVRFMGMGNGASLLPKYHLKCVQCGCEFDPHSGIQITMGNRAKAEPAIPIINSTRS